MATDDDHVDRNLLQHDTPPLEDDAVSSLSSRPSSVVSGAPDDMSISIISSEPDAESLLPAAGINVKPEDSESATAQAQTDEPAVTTLQTSSSTLFLAILFATFAIFSWIITCILAHRTITLGHYDVRVDKYGSYDYRPKLQGTQTDFQKSEQWHRVTRVIQSVLAILTIPVTSAVCAKAAVVYMQRRRTALSLRRTMILADRGWTSPTVLFTIVNPARYKLYGSSFLLIAILVNLLGATIAPLQSIFLTSHPIKVPTSPLRAYGLPDVFDLVSANPPVAGDNNLLPSRLRNALISTDNFEPQARLWTGGAKNCSSDNFNDPICSQGGASLNSLTSLQDPFLSQLPSTFTTGLVRQFMFRINSSVTRDRVLDSEFPTNCESLPGAFYVNYGLTGVTRSVDDGNWTITACMPQNHTISPWKRVASRQDFSEVLYLKLATCGYMQGCQNGTFKIVTNTTAGYFEAPNQMNGNTPGPLLSDGPRGRCGHDCVSQGLEDPPYRLTKKDLTNPNVINSTSIETAYLESDGRNRGPLLTVAIALFGEGSFISERLRRPDAYIQRNTKDAYDKNPAFDTCVEQAPFVSLLKLSIADISVVGVLSASGFARCLRRAANDVYWVHRQLADYTRMFVFNMNGDHKITMAFASAVFLANEAWLSSGTNARSTAYYDYGVDTLVPDISLAGMIVVSIALAFYLILLLALALYSSRTPLWTEQLDSFAMMRLGANAIADTPIRAGKTKHFKLLDETPGWLGDANSKTKSTGQLALGAHDHLVEKRKYAAYTKVKRR